MNKNRRFSGIIKLYGNIGYKNIANAKIAIIGVGGVGSWVAEALARSGLEKITLIDKDFVSESNINRQLPALSSTLGESKVTVVAKRLQQINPDISVKLVKSFVNDSNIIECIKCRYDWVIDCIDESKIKATIINYCCKNNLPIITIGGAGNKLDTTCIGLTDLASTEGDALLSRTRRILRHDKKFQITEKDLFNIPAVWSSEKNNLKRNDEEEKDSSLNCHGYGSCMPVTAAFGLASAGYVLNKLASGEK